MEKNNFLIYGSYGYTGNLIAEYAIEQGLTPVLGGRNKEKLSAQAKRLNLDYRVFDLADFEQTQKSLLPFLAVIHCAGPFIKTYKTMAQACIEARTHYLDITGEVGVIEGLIKMNNQALAANTMLLPGAGFDVVPSDCLAQYLKSKLPDATQLTLAIHALTNKSDTGFSVSQGTALTMAEGLAQGSLLRDSGVLREIPLGFKKRLFHFSSDKLISCTTIPWGDLASAWWSTGIPHIETYMATPSKLILLYKLINPIKGIFKWPFVQAYIQKQIRKMPEGPSAKDREDCGAEIYGEVTNAAGTKVAALLHTPNGYKLTAISTVLIIKKILAGSAPAGFQTPSTAYTQDLVLEIPGVKRELL